MRRALLLLGLAACAEPSSLRVEVAVRDRALSAIELEVARDPGAGEQLAFSCRLDASGVSDCPFEQAGEPWTGGQALSFVLYGTPPRELRVDLTGLSGAQAVSSTGALPRLPEAGGEQGQLSLVLPARTEVRRRCTLEIGPSASSDADQRSALTVAELDGDPTTREILAGSYGGQAERSSLALIRYAARGPGECELSRISLGGPEGETRLPCAISPSTLVVAPGALGEESMAVAQCVRSRPGYVVTRLNGGTATSTVFDLPYTSDRSCSAPAVLDLDGDQRREVYVVCSSTNLVNLHVWRRPGDLHRVVLSGLEATSPAINVPPMPILIDRGGLRALVFAGFGVNLGFLLPGERYVSISRTTLAEGSLARIPAGWFSPPNLLQIVEPHLRGTVLVEALVAGTGVQFVGSRILDPVEQSPDRSIRHRASLGLLDGGATPSALFGNDGWAWTTPLEEGGRQSLVRLWPTAIDDEQNVLLANVDGLPGAELIAFSDLDAHLFGATPQGEPLPGFPIDLVLGKAPRVGLADLDGTQERSLEIAVLSGQVLQVFSLGPGSYDPEGLPWPLIHGDAAAGGLSGPD